ncbi:MAG: aromatic amino acid lyase, partial [Proteobacteria bacterium]|nr:aromatic amino acid lyase [Pseudomonadota bacterium]
HAEALGWQGYSRQMAGSLARSTKLSERKAWIEQLQVWQVALDQKRSRDLRVAAMPVQERYSIRCAPQILLDIAENLQFAADKIAEEALGLADNPILLEDGIWHGGLFYTAGLSTAAELMQNAVLRMADLMDKQILLTVTPELNHGLPANLMRHAGDHVKGLHQLASAILQKIRGMSQPPALLSFSCESHNQDVVPASMTALLLLQESLGLVQEIARIHFFIGERAWALRYQDYLPESLYLAAWSEYRVDRNLAAYLCPR